MVLTDTFSEWLEAFTSRTAIVQEVTKVLLQEVTLYHTLEFQPPYLQIEGHTSFQKLYSKLAASLAYIGNFILHIIPNQMAKWKK